MHKVMLSSEFLEKIKNGEKEFVGIQLNYADLSGNRFEGLRIRNSKMLFTMLRHCAFKNVVFENCEIFFGAFGHSEFQNTKFINCQIDYSGFTYAKFADSKMVNTGLSWTSLIEADLSGLEMTNCSEFKVVRSISEITSADVENALGNLDPIIQQLDFDMRQKIRKLIQDLAEHYKIQLPQTSAKQQGGYGESSAMLQAGYRIFDALLDRTVSIYGEKNPYQAKNIYETGVEKKDPRERR